MRESGVGSAASHPPSRERASGSRYERMNICFLCKRWDAMDVHNDATLLLVHEAALRGHRVGIMSPGNLTIRGNVTYGNCSLLQPGEKVPDSYATFHKKAVFEKKRVPLNGFDTIFFRVEPPVDPMLYYFLDSVKDDVFIINDVDGLKKANNKIYTTTFEDAHDFIPETFVSKDVEYLESVIRESNEDKMILKPLDGFGGAGVILLETKAKANVRSLLHFYVQGRDTEAKNYVILQRYVEGADQGDVRILVLNGEPIGAMRRVPPGGDIRSNVSSGGTAEKHALTKKEKELCALVGRKLVSDGIYFAGLDVIGGKLIEVNVLCPGGVGRINKFNKVRLQKKVLDFAELVHRKRDQLMKKKMEFRRAVEGDGPAS